MTDEEYQREPLTAEEFHVWKDKRTTKKVFYLLNEEKDIASVVLTGGGTLAKPDMVVQQTARMVGMIEGINKVLEMEVDDDE